MDNYLTDPESEQLSASGLTIKMVGRFDKKGVNSMIPRRILNRYALVLLAEGGGTFISASTSHQRVNAEDLILTFPDEWHHYGPENGEKWIEYFCIFDGFIPRTHQANGLFDPSRPILRNSGTPELQALFHEAYQQMKKRAPNYPEIVQANLFQIITKAFIATSAAGTATETMTNSIKEELSMRYHAPINLRKLLTSSGYQYDYARRIFREQTGVSPGTYLTRLRMGEAKRLLIETNLTSAEIGYRIGINDPAYFSRTFKKQIGLRPSAFREKFRLLGYAAPS